MKILYLGPHSPLVDFLGKVTRTEDPISDFGSADFVVSYGYRHIIKNKEELKRMDGRAVNLHISYLPWNRGADPNLWSWVENSPKGVSIHYIDEGIDTGDIVAQSLVSMDDCETLVSSYLALHTAVQRLFRDYWPSIKLGTCQRKPQSWSGTYHRISDRENVHIPNGWETRVSDLRYSDSGDRRVFGVA